MNDGYGVAIIGLAGAVIGAVASVGGQLLHRHLDHRAERRAVGASIAAEIQAYIELMRRRDHRSFLLRAAASADAGIMPNLSSMLTESEKTLSPFPVIDRHLGSIGVLGDCAAKVARFYSLVVAVRATLIANLEGKHSSFPPQSIATLIRSELAVWDEALDLGEEIVKELGPRHRRRLAIRSNLRAHYPEGAEWRSLR